jgi:hypothetical protein
LLVVAFDVVFASCFVPLMAAVYLPHTTPNAGLLSCVAGGISRVILEFALPKDGTLVAFGSYALHYGSAIAGLPSFMEIKPASAAGSAGVWDPEKDTCEQEPMRDWTGLDSIVSPIISLLVLMAVQAFEGESGRDRDLLYFIPKKCGRARSYLRFVVSAVYFGGETWQGGKRPRACPAHSWPCILRSPPQHAC